MNGLLLSSLVALAATSTGGRITVRDGATALASFVPQTAAGKRGEPVVREVAVGGHRLIEVRLPVRGTERQELWLAERRGTGAAPLWSGFVGALDEDGETTRTLVLGEGVDLYESAARVSRCDGVPARLFARRWDFTRGRFEALPPALPPPGPSASARHEERSRPARGGFSFTAASTGAASAEALGPPAALNDRDPGTAWIAAPGAFVTARTGAEGLAVTGVRMTPARGKAPPQRLTLLLGPGDDHRFDVEVTEGATWLALPHPVLSACVTVLAREAGAIGDLEVVTDLDGPDGLARLVRATREGGACEGRVPLLVAAGAVEPVAQAIAAGPAPGRECLLDALLRLLPEAPGKDVGKALVAGLAGASEAEEKLVLAALVRLPEPPVQALAAVLSDERRSEDDRRRAGRALALLPAGRQALLGAVGLGSPALRATVREALASGAPPLAAAARQALAAATTVDRRADLVLVMATASAREPAQRPATLAALEAALGDREFAVQARAIEALGRLGDDAALAALATLRARSADPVLRYLAARELASGSAALTLPALRAALEDGDPRVRETAATALGGRHDAAAASALVAAAKREPWPFARRAQVAALGQLCAPGSGDLLLRAVERDVPTVRRVAMEGLARCRDPRAPAQLLSRLESEGEDPELRTVAARLIGGQGDRSVTPRLARLLEGLGSEAQAEPALEGVAVATMQSLARLGGPDAVRGALALLRGPRPGLRRAALDALGMLCAPEGSPAIEAALRDRDATVAAAARAARRQCAARP